MKLYLKILLLINVCFLSSLLSAQNKGLSILNKSVKAMNELDYFTMTVETDLFLPMTNEKIHITSDLYFDFTSKDTLIGAKYIQKSKHIETKTLREESYTKIFNGVDHYLSMDTRQVILKSNTHKKENVNMFSGSSLAGLRKVLPKIIKNKKHTIVQKKDSIINGVPSYAFDFELVNSSITGSLLKSFTTKKLMIGKYQLFINKKTLLPSSDVKYSINNYVELSINVVSHFQNIKKVKPVDKKNLNVSYFPEHYKIYDVDEYYSKEYYKTDNLLNNSMDNFNLLSVNNKQVNLKDFKNQFVLLEFMFVGCGPCIHAITELNTLKETYKNQLEIISIDFQNSKLDTLKKYSLKTGMKFQILSDGKNLAKKYGINLAPTFLLLDKSQKVIWLHRGYTEGNITKVLQKNL